MFFKKQMFVVTITTHTETELFVREDRLRKFKGRKIKAQLKLS